MRKTVSVRLPPSAARRLETAARLMGQSQGAFLEKAGDELARPILRGWAADQYRQGRASFSELAAETGLAVEEIMDTLGTDSRDEALALFLASCRAIADTRQRPEFLQMAREAVAALSADRSAVPLTSE
ncbi:MAG: hypothetical protein ACRDIY_09465 [Chloroflexota bacterium]